MFEGGPFWAPEPVGRQGPVLPGLCPELLTLAPEKRPVLAVGDPGQRPGRGSAGLAWLLTGPPSHARGPCLHGQQQGLGPHWDPQSRAWKKVGSELAQVFLAVPGILVVGE